MDITQRIEELKKEIRETPYHKATERHIGLLRARIAKLEDEQFTRTSRAKGGGGGGFAIKKTGDATIVLVGAPSVGKSTLLNALTNARSTVAPYAFTTVTVIPGMMKYKNAYIQILDVPGLIEGASRGKGRGREVLSVVRGSDLLVFITDVGHEGHFEKMEAELTKAGIRVNEDRPKIRIEKKLKGGLEIRKNVAQEIADETIRGIASEFGFKNAEITLKEKFTLEKVVDAFAQNRVYVKAIYIVNKTDTSVLTFADAQVKIDVGKTGVHLKGVRTNFPTFGVSAKTGKGLDELREAIWQTLGFARVYLTKGGEIDYDGPFIMSDGATLADVANKIGTEFATGVKGAKISGPGAKFPNQEVPLKTIVRDEQIVTFF
ncbi:50S ribosome-binding GTPase [Candidatus Nomurabacteria bacterium]|nr:50S ribosome-binding GTPase [Candidatus Nomurabacteria bacterium]